MHSLKRLTSIFCITLVTSCSGIELDQRNSVPPRLSGTWVLDREASDPTPDLKGGLRERRSRRRSEPSEIHSRELREASGSGIAFIVHDFQVLSAEKLEIELNHDSMGIRYEPGVYRDVSWGQRERSLWEIYAGWELAQLVIVSTTDGIRVVERYERRGDQLRVFVAIAADRQQRTVVRVFNRG